MNYKTSSILLVVIVFLMIGCSQQRERSNDHSVTVKTIVIDTGVFTNAPHYIATIEPEMEAGLSFQVAGNVESVAITEGQFVKKGTFLARLSKGQLGNAYASARAGYDRAKDAYNRMKALYDQKSLPEIKYIEIQSDLQQAKAQLESSQKDLENCILYAPFDGIISRKNIEIGINVSPGIPVANLIKISQVNAKIAIPEKDISQIKTGQIVKIEIPVINETFTGSITEKNLAPNSLSQTYDIKIKLQNPANHLLPGMVGDAKIIEPSATAYVVVPPAAVQLFPNDKTFVWVIDSGGRAKQQEVITARQTQDGIQITSGIKTGDRVIVEGFQKLSEGITVKEQ